MTEAKKFDSGRPDLTPVVKSKTTRRIVPFDQFDQFDHVSFVGIYAPHATARLRACVYLSTPPKSDLVKSVKRVNTTPPYCDPAGSIKGCARVKSAVPKSQLGVTQ